MDVVIMGLALAFNILVIIWKIKHRSKTDGFTDALLLGVVMYLAGNTLTGMLVGTVASFTVSMYLLFNPIEPIQLPKFSISFNWFKIPKFKLTTLKWRIPKVNIKW